MEQSEEGSRAGRKGWSVKAEGISPAFFCFHMSDSVLTIKNKREAMLNKKTYFFFLILLMLLTVSGCSKNERSEEEQIAYESAVTEARNEYLYKSMSEVYSKAKEYGISATYIDEERETEFFNSLFDYLLSTHEIRELQLNDGSKREIEALKEKQTEALNGISFYVKRTDIIDIRFQILEEKGTFDESLFVERVTQLLIESIISYVIHWNGLSL